MQLTIKDISIKKIDAYRESSFPIKQKKEIQILVNINIALIELKKVEDDGAILKSNFTLDMSDIGHIDAQLDTFATIDDLDMLISDWEKSDKRDLPNDMRGQFDNAIFYYMMPLVMSMAEKLKMPLPIPPIHVKKKQVD